MDSDKKQKAYNDLMELSSRIGNISNMYKQMKANIIEIPDFLEGIWDDGYKHGMANAKKEQEIKIKLSN